MVKSGKMKTELAFLSIFCLMILGLNQPLSVHAAPKQQNAFEMGKEFYQKGEYAKACHYLEHVTRLRPNFWPAHYALGNAYMKMGEFQLAKVSYMSCLLAKPDIPTCKNCSKAIEYLHIAIAKKEKEQNEAQVAQAAPNTNATQTSQATQAIDSAQVAQAQENEAYELKVKELTQKRDAILAEGERNIAAIRDKYEARIKWVHENTNQHVINRATGDFGTGLDVDTHREICAERDEEIKKAHELAEIRARGIHIPPPPTIGISLSSSNLHANSNAFVRHYKHKSPHHTITPTPTATTQNRKVAANTTATTSK